MATMIPETIPFDAPDSEQQVFKLLRDDPLTDGWVVIWSYRPRLYYLDGRRRREVDFLMLIPNKGILCLEVKGGRFNIRGGQWYPYGSRESVETPDRQAEQAMFTLRDELRQQFPANNDIKAMPIDFAVAFTGWEWPDDLDQPTPLIYDKSVLDIHGQFVQYLADDAGKLKASVDPGRRRTRRPNDHTINRLVSFLAPDYKPALGPQLDRIDEQLVRLTREQLAILDMVSENDRCLIKGAAGTGKTMLALEYARRAAHSGKRVGLLCFNVLLGNYLEDQTRDSDGITAGAFWPHIIRPLILSSSDADNFRRDEESVGTNENKLYECVYPRYAELALTESGPRFDVLVVDEVPDFCRPRYLEFMDLLLEGGLRGGRWVMFGDFSNQAIFPGSVADPEGALLRYFEYPARFSLRVNCRNTPAIVRDTACIAGCDMAETRQIDGPSPEYRYWQDAAELSGLLDEEVHRLLEQDVGIEEIVVLSERRLENSCLNTNRTYGGHRLVTYSRGQRIADKNDDGTPRLKYCTIPSFKGMESQVVILILHRLDEDSGELERYFDGPNARAYAYIGMSRACGALVVLADTGLHDELESRLAS